MEIQVGGACRENEGWMNTYGVWGVINICNSNILFMVYESLTSMLLHLISIKSNRMATTKVT